MGHFTIYVIYPSIEHRKDFWEILFVYPVIKAKALANDLVAPSSLIVSSAISLKYGKTYSLEMTEFP